MATIHHVEKPVYIRESDEEKIIVDMSNISEGNESLLNINRNLSFKIKDNIFIINVDKFSKETINHLKEINKIKLFIYTDTIEKKLNLIKI